jgi:hypothetical protein
MFVMIATAVLLENASEGNLKSRSDTKVEGGALSAHMYSRKPVSSSIGLLFAAASSIALISTTERCI